jgi:hypothetical protein
MRTATSTGIFSSRGSGIVGMSIEIVDAQPVPSRAATQISEARRGFVVKSL